MSAWGFDLFLPNRLGTSARSWMIVSAFSLYLPISAGAAELYIDVAGAGAAEYPGSMGLPFPWGDNDSLTSTITGMTLVSRSVVDVYDTQPDSEFGIGDRFQQFSYGIVTDLLPVNGDDEGLGIFSEITFVSESIQGRVDSVLADASSIHYNYSFMPGTRLQFFFDGASYDAHFDNGHSVGFDDGTPIMELEVTGGEGVLRADAVSMEFEQGSATLETKVVSALDGFFYVKGQDGVPDQSLSDFILENASFGWSFDYNTDVDVMDFTDMGAAGPDGLGSQLFAAKASNDASARAGFVVVAHDNAQLPLPGSLVLLTAGGCVLGLCGFRRRRLPINFR